MGRVTLFSLARAPKGEKNFGMRRRQFFLVWPLFAAGCGGPRGGGASSTRGGAEPAHERAARAGERRVAITMDDPNTGETPRLGVEERQRLILGHLAARGVQVMVFVCGKRVDSPQGAELLRSLNDAGHLLANHSYSHRFYNRGESTAEDLAVDIAQCESLIAHHGGFRRRFRFPYLKEGETAEKRDALRGVLRAQGYENGHVTIDASDWAYDGRLVARLEADPGIDVAPFRVAYLAHMLDRARYYDALAMRVVGRRVAHTLLLHHNLLNALFLGDLIDALEREGFRVISPEAAYADPVFAREPVSVPAGESLVWALAHDDAGLRGGLRYPAEDEVYEAEVLQRL